MLKFLLSFFLLFSKNIYSENKKVEYIKDLLNKTLEIVDNKKDSEIEKKNKIITLYSENFDFYWNARVAIASHWSKMSQEQKKKYIDNYILLICYTWIVKFSNYKNDNGIKIKVNPEVNTISNIDDIIETKIIPPNGENFSIDILTRSVQNNQFKVLNLIVEGINVALAYKSQFNEIMNSNKDDIDMLIQTLIDKNKINKQNNPDLIVKLPPYEI